MMSELTKSLLLVSLYGGPGLLALFIILIGTLQAQRKSSVIALSIVAGVCVLLNAVLLYFLSDLTGAWSGGNSTDDILIVGGAGLMLLGAAAIPLFVSRKLMHADGVGPTDTVRGPAIAILVFLIVYVASTLLRPSPLPGLTALLAPRFWLVVVVSGVAAWGLWRHSSWAWWLGLAGVTWELFRFMQNVALNPDIAAFLVFSVPGFIAFMQAIILILLLRKNVRVTCLG